MAEQSGSEIEVTFAEPGPLGLSFGSVGQTYDDAAGPKLVLAVEEHGSAAQMEHCPIEAGLELVKVQDQPCQELSFSETLDLIQASGRPLTLCFRWPESKPKWVQDAELVQTSWDQQNEEQPKAIALHNFSGEEEGDLAFRAGDTIILTEHNEGEDTWWTGYREESGPPGGTFPSNFVELQKHQPVQLPPVEKSPVPSAEPKPSPKSAVECDTPDTNPGPGPGPGANPDPLEPESGPETETIPEPEPEPELEPEPEPESGSEYQEMKAPNPPDVNTQVALVVRRYCQETDAEAVRRIWPAGLLANTRDARLGYPPTLITEEKEFVQQTMEYGDMCDLQAAYQSDPAGITDFWVVVEQGGAVPVGMVGLRNTDQVGVGDIGRFGVDEAYRGRGAARLLLRELERHAWGVGLTKITATTCGLNTPALAAFEACGFRIVFNGRKDGKKQPEWAPFARLEKHAPDHSSRQTDIDIQRQRALQQVIQKMETQLQEDTDEDAEVEEHMAQDARRTASSVESQARIELLLQECKNLRSEKAQLEEQILKLTESHNAEAEKLAQAAAAAAISAVRDQMEKTAEEAGRLRDENTVLRQQLTATLLHLNGNDIGVGSMRSDASNDEYYRANDDSLELSLGISPNVAGSGESPDSAFVSPVLMTDADNVNYGSTSTRSLGQSTPQQQQRRSPRRFSFEHAETVDGNTTQQSPKERSPQTIADGDKQRLKSLNHQVQKVTDTSIDHEVFGMYVNSGSLSPQEVLVSRLIVTGTDESSADHSAIHGSPPQPASVERVAEHAVARSGGSAGHAAATVPAAINGNAAWLPRGTPGRKPRGSPLSTGGDEIQQRRSSKSVYSARRNVSTRPAGRTAGAMVPTSEATPTARQSEIWAAGLRESGSGTTRESASARRRRRLMNAASSQPRTPQRR